MGYVGPRLAPLVPVIAASASEVAAGTAVAVEADAALGLGLVAVPELVVGVTIVIGVSMIVGAIMSASDGQQGRVRDPGEYYDQGTARTQIRTTTHNPTVTVSVTNGIRTTTQTTWATQYTTRTTTYSNGSTTTQSATRRIITAQQVFSEPVVNPNRPGWTVTQTAPSAGMVTTPYSALSTNAEDCGLGGSIASCQTPPRGAIQCSGISATAQLCQPAEPAPGSPGGVQANLPLQHPESTTGQQEALPPVIAPSPEPLTGGDSGGIPPPTQTVNGTCEPDDDGDRAAEADGLLAPGPFAGRSIPGDATRNFTREQRNEINKIMGESGCHRCGTCDPGTKSGDAIPDHQPPLSQSDGPYRLYPHCKACSWDQLQEIARLRRIGR